MSDTTLGQLIKARRENLKVSMRKFALMVGVSTGYISQVERDLCSPPTEVTLIKMSRELEMSSDSLILKAGKIPSDIINGMLEFPASFSLARQYIEQQRVQKQQTQNVEVPLNE